MVPVIDGVELYSEIIRNSPESDKYKLIDLLAGYNAKEGAIAILENLMNSLKTINERSAERVISDTVSNTLTSSSNGGGSPKVSEPTALILPHIKRGQDLIIAAEKELDKLGSSNISKKELDEIFARQKAINTERGYKSKQ
jgi:hypothetical protein